MKIGPNLAELNNLSGTHHAAEFSCKADLVEAPLATPIPVVLYQVAYHWTATISLKLICETRMKKYALVKKLFEKENELHLCSSSFISPSMNSH